MKKVFLILVTISFSLAGSSGCRYFETTPTPTEVYKSHYEAELKKDLAVLRQNISKDSLEMLRETAKKMNLDETSLVENSLGISKSGLPRIRNEKINGDTATIETENNLTGEWDKMPFVKEEGRWKINLKKYIEDAVKQFNNN